MIMNVAGFISVNKCHYKILICNWFRAIFESVMFVPYFFSYYFFAPHWFAIGNVMPEVDYSYFEN